MLENDEFKSFIELDKGFETVAMPQKRHKKTKDRNLNRLLVRHDSDKIEKGIQGLNDFSKTEIDILANHDIRALPKRRQSGVESEHGYHQQGTYALRGNTYILVNAQCQC